MTNNKLMDSFSCAISGIVQAVRCGRNMKIHLLAAVIVVCLAKWADFSGIEWAVLLLTIFMVLAAETMNTALEKAVDLVTKEYHPLAGQAKNMAAGSVLLTAICAVIIGFILFAHHFIAI